MRRMVLIWAIVFSGMTKLWAERTEGTPFLVNYATEEYGAHDRNEAVVCDRKGNVYFANFEGVLCYDGQEWQLVTTPGISRVTSLFIDSEDRVYAGGYNVVGKVERKERDKWVFRAYLDDAGEKTERIGEVRSILRYGEQTVFVGEEGLVWVENDSVRVERLGKKLDRGFCIGGRLLVRPEEGGLWEWQDGEWQSIEENPLRNLRGTVVRELPGRGWVAGTDNGLFFRNREESKWVPVEDIPGDARVTDVIVTVDTLVIVATATYGVFFLNKQLEVYCSTDEERGLCSNVVNGLAVDGKGSVWLATGKGIARMSVGSMYSRYTEREGLMGEVLTMEKEGEDLYVGTYRGLFCWSRETGRFIGVKGIKQACWQLKKDRQGRLWAATGGGLFEIKNRKAGRWQAYFTMSVATDRMGQVYSGEQDAVYVYRRTGRELERQLFAALGQVNELVVDGKEGVWMTTIFGEVYRQERKGGKVVQVKGLKNRLGNRITFFREQVLVLAQDGFYAEAGRDSVGKMRPEKNFLPVESWAGSCVEDTEKRIWLTQGNDKGMWVYGENKEVEDCRNRLKAVERYNIRVVYVEKEVVWLGGSFGLIRLDLKKWDPDFEQNPMVYLRKAVQETGYGRNIRFAFASDAPGMVNPVTYSFRLRGFEEEWSPWTEGKEKEYVRLPYGRYGFEVKARDAFGKESLPERYEFRVPAPFYWKWYAWVIYAGLLVVGAGGIMKWRTRRLWEANQRLEQVVEKRTQEIRMQRDEITRKSQQLEQTLEQLNKAQDDLIRQEKMATVGKLTQGLVDRILNPLNYIGNFAVLARGLATEAGKVLKAEAEKIPEELEADMQEILEMLSGNLTKIVEHGESTARILKAMEEILKERKCMPVPVEMNGLCRRCMEQLETWFTREIVEKKVRLVCETEPEEVMALVDERQFEKVVMSVLGNGMYGLLKKWEKGSFEPRLSLRLNVEEGRLKMVIRDNGIGIEESVLEKVFDPFFTTRSTAEAAGVGLYLCREVILNHKGDISIRSCQGEWTEVTITLKRTQRDGSFVRLDKEEADVAVNQLPG